MPGRIECVEREAFAGPVREQLDHPTIVQHVLNAKRLSPRNACTSRTGSQLGVHVAEYQTHRHVDRHDLIILVKLPYEGPPCHRISEMDTGMVRQFGRMPRPAISLDIAGRSDGEETGLQQLMRHSGG